MNRRHTCTKTILILALGGIFMAAGLSAMELEKRQQDGQAVPEEKAETKAETEIKTETRPDTGGIKLLLEGRFHSGLTYPVGKVATPDDSTRVGGTAWGFDTGLGYRLSGDDAIMMGISFNQSSYSIRRPYMGQTMKSLYIIRSFRFSAGYRFVFDLFFIEPGLYYGIHIGPRKERQYIGGSYSRTNHVSGNNEPGCYLLTGVRSRVNEEMDVNGGILLEGAFMPGVENENTLYTLGAQVFTGVTYRFRIRELK